MDACFCDDVEESQNNKRHEREREREKKANIKKKKKQMDTLAPQKPHEQTGESVHLSF